MDYAQAELYWYVDNVVVHFLAPWLNEACAAPGSSPPPIPDGSVGGSPMLAARVTPDGSEISVAWDNQCAPSSVKIVYGPLDQVSAYTIFGSVCGIANPESWTAVPAGDLWFVVIAGDGVGVEGSWGLATGGERNGLTPKQHMRGNVEGDHRELPVATSAGTRLRSRRSGSTPCAPTHANEQWTDQADEPSG